ncbi:hypothetical protein AMTRI_Chr08g208560 [Amborella trichopoda]
MFVMPNIFNLICMCLHSALHLGGFFFAKLPEACIVFNPTVDVMPVIHLFFFSLSLCLASCCNFQ